MNEPATTPETQGEKRQSWLKIAIGLGVVAALGIVLFQFGDQIQASLENALDWIEGLGPVGPIVFVVIYALATVLFLPGSPLTLGAGVVFGLVQGTLCVLVGATIGANLAFLVGRYLARERVAKMIEGNAKFAAIDRAIAKEGWKIVGLIRLSPLFPFNVLNYALGLTNVSFQDNLLGTMGIAPGTFMYVYFGSLLGNTLSSMDTEATNPEADRVRLIINVVGFIITVAVTLYVTRVAQKALKETVDEPSNAAVES